jgi:hypothetical protein
MAEKESEILEETRQCEKYPQCAHVHDYIMSTVHEVIRIIWNEITGGNPHGEISPEMQKYESPVVCARIINLLKTSGYSKSLHPDKYERREIRRFRELNWSIDEIAYVFDRSAQTVEKICRNIEVSDKPRALESEILNRVKAREDKWAQKARMFDKQIKSRMKRKNR